MIGATDDNSKMVFARVTAFRVKGRGTVAAGLISRAMSAKAGDTLEFRSGAIVNVRSIVIYVGAVHASPPPPSGFDHIGIMIPEDITPDMIDGTDAWLISNRTLKGDK